MRSASKADKPYVLLIDDQVRRLDSFAELMQANGINVISVSDVDSALRAIKYADIDLVLCDINLDPRNATDKSGFRVAEFAAKARPGLPLVAYTGLFRATDFSKSEKSLFTKFYAKGGASPSEMTSRIKELRKIALRHRASLARGRERAASSVKYDVFLCHNSADKPLVRRLAKRLIEQGIKPWYDEWDLIPGRPWQEALEAAIARIRSAAILVGESGIGPWADREMRAFLGEFVRRGVSVIPVMLPGAPATPDLPLFIREFTWVDLRHGIRSESIKRLVWGITGSKVSN